ncbi:MAG: Lrp/AsnC family transcriptional regulator [Thermoprotei archaeon]|nr:MAG: Lrp/AsnC family transcriptional regulator [Thermoprotei archaeon]
MPALDPVDKQVIKILQENGRLSLTEIGRRLGVSHVAVGKRLEKLTAQGVIKVQANLGLKPLNLRLLAVLIEVEGREALDKLCQVFSECPRMLLLSTLIAGFNLFALMVAEDERVLESITTCCAVRDTPGIKRTEIYLMGNVVLPRYVPLRVTTDYKEEAPCGRNCASCSRFKEDRCPGCPAVKGYKGSL